MYALVCAGAGPRTGHVPAYGPLRGHGAVAEAVAASRYKDEGLWELLLLRPFAWAGYLEARGENDDWPS